MCKTAPMSSQCGTCSQWGGGKDRLKINLRQECAVKTKEGAETDRKTAEKVSREVKSLAQAGSMDSPLAPLFTHREISDNFTASLFSGQWKGTDSFLVTHPLSSWEWLLSWENPNLWHPQWVTALRCAIASVQTAAPSNACEICVHTGSRAHCWD